MNYQFTKYAKAQGKDPHTLTTDQRQELKSEMIKDLYPGAYTSANHVGGACIWIISGLDKSPEIIQDTMSPDLSPESAAGSAVVVNRGYNQDLYAVS